MLLQTAFSPYQGTAVIISQTKSPPLTLSDKTFDFFAEGKKGQVSWEEQVNKKRLFYFQRKKRLIIVSINGIKIYLPISSKLIDNSFVRYNNATNYKPNHLLYKYYYVCKLG